MNTDRGGYGIADALVLLPARGLTKPAQTNSSAEWMNWQEMTYCTLMIVAGVFFFERIRSKSAHIANNVCKHGKKTVM